MMHPSKLFQRIHRRDNYKHIGFDLSYKHFIDREDKIIYVCFQGSNGLTDWLHNLLALPTRIEPYRGCGWFVHKGFARVWRSGNDTVMEETRALAERLPGFEIIFCGFSHGAALAQLAAQNWFFLTKEKRKCIIFGSPKLAWGDNAQRILNDSMELTNWINRADIVTTVPLRKWGYRHVRENLVDVRRIPFLSKLRVRKHHQIYDRPEIYPPTSKNTGE
ncbi:MAG: hypothetical protein FWC36_06480 [Spirochaetes bacterium]|nr:hypothetical protein [Spirochaetota bacterium]